MARFMYVSFQSIQDSSQDSKEVTQKKLCTRNYSPQ